MIYLIPSKDKNSEFYDPELAKLPDDQFDILVKWRINRNNITHAVEAFNVFYNVFEGDSLEGNKKKKIPPRNDLLFIRSAMRRSIIELTAESYALLRKGYTKTPEGKIVFNKKLFG